ncbi:MAG: histidinol-phosphate transaminase [Chitinophagaceae bacterium]
MFNLDQLLRENIKNLVAYSSARHEFSGEASIFLDANENSFGSPLEKNYNRYPDPLQKKLKEKISRIKGISPNHLFLGNGSDEAIDLLFRAFCRPGTDEVIICPPTYGMYEVAAQINEVGVKRINLTPDFQLDLPALVAGIGLRTKMIFICSPNNPSGNSIYRKDIEFLLHHFEGLIILDEAYINFSKQKSFLMELQEFPNLVILQTLSKAWGLAGLRLGMAFASQEIISIFNKIKPPYNISQASQELALSALDQLEQVNAWTQEIVHQRELLSQELLQLPLIKNIYPSDANFLLVQTIDPKGVYDYLMGKGIVVRDRSRVDLCEGCLRITIGNSEENQALLQQLRHYA